jgi:hypothetical protein
MDVLATWKATGSGPKELDHRSADGLEVTLVWDADANVASVIVVDTKNGEAFEIVLEDRDNALDVFHHPYAYATLRGLFDDASTTDYAAPLPA